MTVFYKMAASFIGRARGDIFHISQDDSGSGEAALPYHNGEIFPLKGHNT